jgi:hypothetical protein
LPDREIDLRERGEPPTFQCVGFFQARDVDLSITRHPAQKAQIAVIVL